MIQAWIEEPRSINITAATAGNLTVAHGLTDIHGTQRIPIILSILPMSGAPFMIQTPLMMPMPPIQTPPFDQDKQPHRRTESTPQGGRPLAEPRPLRPGSGGKRSPLSTLPKPPSPVLLKQGQGKSSKPRQEGTRCS